MNTNEIHLNDIADDLLIFKAFSSVIASLYFPFSNCFNVSQIFLRFVFFSSMSSPR